MRSLLLPALFPALLLSVALTGCTGSHSASAKTTTQPQIQPAVMEETRSEMDLIPPPSKTRYMAVKSLTEWENPYVTVQGDMVNLHVTMADANPSELGKGGLLRPMGARRQELNVRLSDLPNALAAVPANSWPYGRVVAIEEAHQIPADARPMVRRNMESVMKVLNDLGIVIYEWPESGFGLR